MANSISLHIGLNKIDKKHYGSEYPLQGCISDANDMLAIAKQKKYTESYLLVNEQGTYEHVVKHLADAARKLKKGDTLFISYSGHGSYVPDNNKDETDGYDETWCLYDRMIIDDELAVCWTKFKTGVKILMVSDSCHSGTVSRAFQFNENAPDPAGDKRSKLLKNGPAIYKKNKAVYKKTEPSKKNMAQTDDIKTTVILLSGCQDNQTSLDGARNGLFTEKLLKVYNNGKFTGNYAGLLAKILKLMPSDQTPHYTLIGKKNPGFEHSKPFSL
ncbi:MAG: caspase family protein [Niabella sp.]